MIRWHNGPQLQLQPVELAALAAPALTPEQQQVLDRISDPVARAVYRTKLATASWHWTWKRDANAGTRRWSG